MGFLFVKYFEYTGKFHHGIYPSSSTFMGIYFITGLHVLHIIGGLVVLIFYGRDKQINVGRKPRSTANRIEVTGLIGTLLTLCGSYSQFYTCSRISMSNNSDPQ